MEEHSENNENFIIHREGKYEEKWYVRNGYLKIERSGDLAIINDPSKIEILGLENLKDLKCLILIRFPIKEFLEKVQLPKSLGILDLEECFFDESTNLEQLEASRDLKSLRIIEPFFYKKEFFNLENFKGFSFLEELIIRYDNISGMNGLKNFKNLRILELIENKISKIQGLDRLLNLEELRLDGNQISRITGLDNLSRLKVLSLRDNYITRIEGIDNLVNLEELDLSYNNVFEEYYVSRAEIQKYVGHLKKLKKLNGKKYPDSNKYDFSKNIIKKSKN